MNDSAPVITLIAVAVSSLVIGFFLQRMLWRHLPRLSGAPTPSFRNDVGAGMVTCILVTTVMAEGGVSWLSLAHSCFAIVAVPLSFIDSRLRILPNSLLLPFSLIASGLLGISAAVEGEWENFGRSLLGAAVLFLVYLCLAVISPAGLGMGDVKLSAVVGLYLAYQGWAWLLIGAAAGFFLGAISGLALLLVRRAHLKSAIPFGPSMLGGALITLFLSAMN